MERTGTSRSCPSRPAREVAGRHVVGKPDAVRGLVESVAGRVHGRGVHRRGRRGGGRTRLTRTSRGTPPPSPRPSPAPARSSSSPKASLQGCDRVALCGLPRLPPSPGARAPNPPASQGPVWPRPGRHRSCGPRSAGSASVDRRGLAARGCFGSPATARPPPQWVRGPPGNFLGHSRHASDSPATSCHPPMPRTAVTASLPTS